MAVNIRADVDDTEVDMAIAKLKQAVTLQAQLTTGRIGTQAGTRTAMREWRSLEKSWSGLAEASREIGTLEKLAGVKLPAISREMRVISSQVPGLARARRHYFNIKRLQEGLGKTLELETFLPLALSLIATAIVLFQEVQRYQKRIERQQHEQEMMIRKYRGWTHEEFERKMAEWRSYTKGLPP